MKVDFEEKITERYSGEAYEGICRCVNPPMAIEEGGGGGGGMDATPQQVFPFFLKNGKSFSCKLNFYL